MDVSPWLRPDAPTSPDRLFCHVYGRAKGQAQMIPGWPYSFVAALETGRTSWTAVLDAVRLGPADDATAVTAAQLREVVDRLIAAGHWTPGDPDIVIVVDTGYDVTRLAHLLADLPVELVGRLRSDRVLRLPGHRARPGTTGRPPKHGPVLALADPATWPAPRAHHQHRHHPLRHRAAPPPGTAATPGWTHRGAWLDHHGELPIIEGTLIRLQVEHLPGDRDPETAVAVDLRSPAATADRRRPWLAGLPAPLRPRTHLPVPQADPRLDHPEAARPRRRRPLDLAGHRRAHPTAPGP